MKKLYTIIILLLTVFTVHAGIPSDSLKIKKDSVFTLHPAQGNGLVVEPTDVLNEGMLISSFTAADSIQFYINQAHAVIKKIRELDNYIDNIDKASKFQLPVGIKKEVGGIKYELAIQAIRLKPTHAELDVFMQFEIPQNGQVLSFMAKNIKFTMKGGIVGDATLMLLGDYAINLSGDKSQIILKGGETFASIDCDGFKELGVAANIKFSRDLIRPEKLDGSVADGNVVGSFKTKITDWNNLLVEFDLPTFQMNGLTGVSFAVHNVVLDFSDTRNALSVQFPEGYKSTQMLPGNPNLWRGFYMRELTVKLPTEFKQRGTTARTTLQASNVIIDNMGLTGKFTGTTLITLQQGDMNGWAFSLDQLSIEIKTNQLVQASFNGKIVIPVSNEKTPFEYTAIINTGGNYLFSVSPTKDISFDVFSAAHVDIYESSYLEITIADHKFLPRANLNGRMGIGAKLSSGGKGVEFANIAFENLEIQAVKPYIKIGNFSFGSEAAQQKMAGFPISIHDIGLKSYSDTEVGLDFNLKLNLVGESNGAFAADAGLTILGTMDAERGWQSWKYKTVRVREISVDIDGGAFKINGKLIFYRNDVVYGDGFNGTVKAEFTPGIKITATAIFGSVKGLRYWYADAMVNFPSAIPIFTGIGIYGFGGGAYFGMKMDNQGLGSELGRTASGVVYVPDEKAGLGLKAIINLGSMPKPEAFNADVTFEISFFRGGGVRYIAFGGNGFLSTPGIDLDMDKMKGAAGKMVSAVNKVADKVPGAVKGLLDNGGDSNSMDNIFGEIGDKAGQKGQISARVMISFDFENHVLHGNFEVYVNVAGGILKGIGPGGRAGWSVLHFAPHEWYIWAGTPDDRMGISVGVGSIQLQATTYFMVGTKILNSPPPPPEVSRILGGVDLDYMKDLNSLGTGAGFAFGASLSINTGELSFLMFYSSFSAGLGFDIMLKNYGEVYCKGSNKRLGVNGWYANGQAYAYFEGAIGIRVKVFGIKKNVEILKIGAAAVLQAKLPNPFWMRGIVGGYFSVLGGMVKGNCKFEVTIGKECDLVKDRNAILDEVKVIAQLTPGDGETDVNVFNAPQALFNIPVNKNFELVDEVSNEKRSFRVALDYFKILDGQNELTGELQWNKEHDVLAFNSYDVLPPKKDLVAIAQVRFEELKAGSWATVLTAGKPVVQALQQAFKTGEAPDYIPPENVEYCYPVSGQLNFYKTESKGGYIKLKKGQPYLFELGPEWKPVGRFKAPGGGVSTFNFAYNTSEKTVHFDFPSTLKTNQVYTLELVNMPAKEAGNIDRNVAQVSNQVSVDGEKVDTEISSKKAEGNIDELQENTLYSSYLRSSTYSTFAEKINSLVFTTGWTRILQTGIHELGITMRGNEYFEKLELAKDVGMSNSLVRFEANMADNNWYQNFVNPLIYFEYPIRGSVSLDRPENPLGIPPFRGVYVRQTSIEYELNERALSTTAPIVWPDKTFLIVNLPLEMAYDYADLRSKCANLSLQVNNPRINDLITKPFPVLRLGEYKVKCQYYLPGLNKVSSEKEITIRYTGFYSE